MPPSTVLPQDSRGHDERAAVIQAISHRSELPRLLSFLRATCPDPLRQESWVSREAVFTAANVDRRQRSVTLREEYVEPVQSSTESPGLRIAPADADAKQQTVRSLVYEERDIRSSTEALIRRRIVTPVASCLSQASSTSTSPRGDDHQQQQQQDKSLEDFLLFQGFVKRSSELAKRGIRCQLTEAVRLSVFAVEESTEQQLQAKAQGAGAASFPLGPAEGLLLVELEAPVEGEGGVLASIEAVKDAAAVLDGFIIVRRRT